MDGSREWILGATDMHTAATGIQELPNLFDEALNKDLLGFRQGHPQVTLLQYVDGLLAASSLQECEQATRSLLMEPQKLGHRDPRRKPSSAPRKLPT